MLSEIYPVHRSSEKPTARPTQQEVPPRSLFHERPFSLAGWALQPQHRIPMAASCSLLLALAAGVFALLKPDVWEASQPLVVRTDALEDRAAEMPEDQKRQNLQETLVTVFQSRTVLEAALRDVGPDRPSSRKFPGLRDVENLRQSLKIVPPSGSEFGGADVVYLKVRARKQSRANALVEAILRHADEHLRNLQVRRVQSKIEELAEAHRAAERRLREELEQLQKIEAAMGLDAVTLRMLEEKPDETSLRASLDDLDSKIQETESRQLAYQQLRDVLKAVEKQPERLQSVPTTLLEAHPALRRLQEALTDAEVKLIELQSHYAEEHPAVIAAQMAVDDLQLRVAEEVPATLQTLHHELAILASQLEFLEKQRKEEAARLDRILGILPRYRELAVRIRSETATLESVQRRLAEAQSALAAAHQTQWIIPLEPVQTGSRPIGPGRLTIVAAGIVCGLALGVAVFLWLTPARHAPHLEEQSQPARHPRRTRAEVAQERPEEVFPTRSSAPPQPRGRPKPGPSPVPTMSCENPSPLHQALLRTAGSMPPLGEAVYER